WAGIAEEIPLGVITALLLEQLPLLIILYSFGHNFHIQTVGHGDNGINEALGIGVITDLADKASINFQCFERKLLQVGQRGIASPEIIDRQAYAQLTQRTDIDLRLGVILHNDTFRNFQLQLSG